MAVFNNVAFPWVKGPEGKRGLWAMDGFFTAVSINNSLSEDKKKKALKLLDYLFFEEGINLLRYGVKGIHYKLNNGEKVPLLPEKQGIIIDLQQVDNTSRIRNMIELGGVWLPEWNQNYEFNLKAIEIGNKYGQVPLFLYEKTDSQKKYGKLLTDLVFREYIEIVKAENFDVRWEQFVEQYLELGGRELIKEVNELNSIILTNK